MALTPAEKQRRYRDRHKATEQTSTDALEQALLREVERGEMSEEERIALADKLTDLALTLQRRAIRLSKLGYKLRVGHDHPRQE